MTPRPSGAVLLAITLTLSCSARSHSRDGVCREELGRTMPAAIRVLPVGDAAIEVHIRGSGEPVVLLPGTGGDASQFDGFASLLSASGYQTIAVSVRGAGGSTGPLRGLTLHDYAADVAGVIRSLDVAPVHVLGRAGGNRVARMLAAEYPDLVASVILVNAGGLVPPDSAASKAMSDWSDGRIGAEEQRAAFRQSMLSPATDPRCVEPSRRWPAANTAQWEASAATSVTDWWAAGKARVLILQGLDDLIALPANGHALAAELGTRAKLVDIPDAGHALLFERPKRVAEEVLAFLRSTP